MAPGLETALVGGSDKKRDKNTASGWALLSSGSSARNAGAWQLSPLTPGVPPGVPWCHHCPREPGDDTENADNNLQAEHSQLLLLKKQDMKPSLLFENSLFWVFVLFKYQGPRCESGEILQWDRYHTKSPEPEKYIIKHTTIKWKEWTVYRQIILHFNFSSHCCCIRTLETILFPSIWHILKIRRPSRYLQPVQLCPNDVCIISYFQIFCWWCLEQGRI